MSVALMLFVGVLLLYVVASGKARAVFTALSGSPAAITNPNVSGAP